MEQQTQEWLDMRREKIGASDAPIIMGVSPWKTPFQLWQEKLGMRDSSYKSASMERGIVMEEEARAWFAEEMGHDIEPKVLVHPSIPYMMASLDGLSADEQVLVEIKCPGPKDHGEAKSGNIPAKYIPQLQHQLEVAGLERGFYLSYDGVENVILPFYRNDKYIKKLLKKEEEFYECMSSFCAPALTSRDFAVCIAPEWEKLAVQWEVVAGEIKKLQEEEKAIRQQLVEMARGKSTRGAGITVQKIYRRGNIDYGEVPELKHVDLEKYRKPAIETWRIGKDKKND